MTRTKWVRWALVVALSATAAAACGGDDDGEEKETPEPVSVETYAAEICGALSDWQTEIQARAAELRARLAPDAPVATQKEALAGYINDLVTFTERLVNSTEKTAPPDVENGREIHDRFLTAFRDARAAFEEARGQVEELPDDPAKFQVAASEVAGQMQTTLSAIGTSLADHGQKELEKAFQENETCQGQQPAA